MISCTEFIPVYSEAFKFLEETQGRAGLEAFWVRLGRAYLGELRQQALARGLRGCFDWWTQALKEEASDFRTTLDEDAGVLEIHLRCCPSMKRLLTLEHMTPHPQYCEHCNVLYRETLEQLGFDYEVDLSECTQAVCRRYVKRRSTT
ncbi:MAG: hypothetical protein H8E44_08790 [Planctomycetes bacterium]|nr:hypothetical protein [Planctomycetota bacterium]MBL7043477.1 hypothetical protein [Pirellulaceae bacterium]